MRTRASSCALIVSLAGICTSSLAMPAAAEEKTEITCDRHGHVVLSPGLVMSSRDFTSSEIGTFGPCRGPGVDGLTGTVTVKTGPQARAHGSCMAAEFAVPFTVAWSDGTTSTGTATGRSFGPLVLAEGVVTTGRLVGRSYTTRVVLLPQDAALCASSGVTEADYVGDITF